VTIGNIRSRRLAALAAAGAVAVSCAGGIPIKDRGIAGEPRFTELSVPDDARTNRVRVSPDEQTVVITTLAGHWRVPPRRLVVYDSALRPVSHVVGSPQDLAFASDGRRIVAGEGTLTSMSLPDLRVHRLASWHAVVDSIVERRDPAEWFVVGQRGEDGIVEVLDDDALSIGRTGKFGVGLKGSSGIGWLRAAALDARTGRLLLLLKPNHMEWFDPKQMQTTSRVELPCASVGFDVAVADGFAFVPTEQGSLLVVNANDGSVVRTVETGGERVDLSLSRSGRTLAVAARELLGDKSVHVRLRVFLHEAGDLKLAAETERTLRHAPNDIAVIEGARVVIVTGDDTLAWHY
jgi:hypothetical protein